QTDERAQLAAGIEPVGAMEVGFHVPGSAAGEVRWRAVLDELWWGDSVAGSEIGMQEWHRVIGENRREKPQSHRDIENKQTQRTPSAQKRYADRRLCVSESLSLLFLCVLCPLSVAPVAAQTRRPRAEVTPLVSSTTVHAGGPVRVALKVSLPEG